MQSDVIRAPNGRVITKHYIAQQYRKNHLSNHSGSQVDATPKSSICFPEVYPALLLLDVAELKNKMARLFESKLDPCFIEIVKAELVRDFGHCPENNWLQGLSLRTKTEWDLFYYYLTLQVLMISLKHDCLNKPTFMFAIHSDQSGIDTRKVNGLSQAVSPYIVNTSLLQVSLILSQSIKSSGLLIKKADKEVKLSLSSVFNLVLNTDTELANRLIQLFLSDVSYKESISLDRSTQILLSAILFMAVTTLSPKVGKVGR